MEYPEAAVDHFVIGLTGNIGVGKSLVRRMLGHLGALGIDADRLAQDAMKKDSPAFSDVITQFGEDILNKQGEINRKKLGAIVFDDGEALKDLEAILHPWVSDATNQIIEQSPLPVVVIEAIKLLESRLVGKCDSIWVVEADPEEVYKRLERSRGMTRAEVDQRLAQQSPVSEKIGQAEAVIHNSGTNLATWEQILEEWKYLVGAVSQPLGMDVLLPSEQNLEWLNGLLYAQPQSPLSLYLNEAIREDRDELLQSLLRFYYLRTSPSEVVLLDMEHFKCNIHAYNNQAGMNIEFTINAIEDFGCQHLCHSFSIPIKKESESLIEGLGYHKQPDQSGCPLVFTKAGYNLYNKADPTIQNWFNG